MASKPKEMEETKSSLNDSKVVPIASVNSESPPIDAMSPQTEIIHRDEKGRFLKGFSGNPHAWATRKLNIPLALLCRENIEHNVNVLQSLINDTTVDAAIRVTAIKLSFEYGCGKPMQASDVRYHENLDYQNFISSLKSKVRNKFGYNMKRNEKSECEVKKFIFNMLNQNTFLNEFLDDIF